MVFGFSLFDGRPLALAVDFKHGVFGCDTNFRELPSELFKRFFASVLVLCVILTVETVGDELFRPLEGTLLLSPTPEAAIFVGCQTLTEEGCGSQLTA